MHRNFSRVFALLAGLALSQSLTAPAQTDERGLDIGAKAPAFNLPDTEGREHALDELLKKGKTALVFHRSADW